MLFSSFEFLLCFLPVVAIAFFGLRQLSQEVSFYFLVFASLFFYGYWNETYLILICSSILANFWLGKALALKRNKKLLSIGVLSNLALLFYYKYLNFFQSNASELLGWNIEIHPIILPLAISFFTFQQIAYLVDSYKGECKEYSFIHYCLFVTFFPQLIAGPIVHHKQMMPQFMEKRPFSSENLYCGLALFAIGLFKKVVIADNLAPSANIIFANAEIIDISSLAAWLGALTYTLQLYFDFSGYADMALGAAMIFGIYIPINFNSPYKSINIIEFWRRWHMTLSQFLRDYLYIPLGGSRCSVYRRYTNLMLTMILGGIWHGAGWNFIVWGLLHGTYLCVNHLWVSITKSSLGVYDNFIYKYFCISITLFSVIIGWVFFRAETFSGATNIIISMFNVNELIRDIPLIFNSSDGLYSTVFTQNPGGMEPTLLCSLVLFLFGVTLFAKNSNEIISELKVNTQSSAWHIAQPIIFGGVLAVALVTLNSIKVTEFLYFQF